MPDIVLAREDDKARRSDFEISDDDKKRARIRCFKRKSAKMNRMAKFVNSVKISNFSKFDGTKTTTPKSDKDDLEAHKVRLQALKGLVNLVKADLASVQSNFRGVEDHEICSGNVALSYVEYLHGIRKFSNAKSFYQKLIQDIKDDKGFQALHIAACNMSKDVVLLAFLCGLGRVEAHTGNFDDAEEILSEALKNAEECFGSHHPNVGGILTC